jgi:hypothetical protein
MDGRCQYQTRINTRIEILCCPAEPGVANPAPEASLTRRSRTRHKRPALPIPTLRGYF